MLIFIKVSDAQTVPPSTRFTPAWRLFVQSQYAMNRLHAGVKCVMVASARWYSLCTRCFNIYQHGLSNSEWLPFLYPQGLNCLENMVFEFNYWTAT